MGPTSETPAATSSVDPTTRRLIDETHAVVRAEFEKLKVSMRERFAERFAKLAQVTAAPSSHRDVMPLHHHAYRRGITTTTDFNSIKSAPLQIHRDAEPLHHIDATTTDSIEQLPCFPTDSGDIVPATATSAAATHEVDPATASSASATDLDTICSISVVCKPVVGPSITEDPMVDPNPSAATPSTIVEPNDTNSSMPATCSTKSPNLVSSSTAPLPVSIITDELLLDPVLAATSSSVFGIVPSTVNIGMPSNCSLKCLCHAVDAMVPAATHVGCVTWSPDQDVCVVMSSTISPITHKELAQATHNLNVFVVSAKVAELHSAWHQQPWPPPILLEFLPHSAMLRPMPWPNFIMSAVLLGEFKRFVLLSKRTSSQCLKCCLMLGSLFVVNYISSAHGCFSWLVTPLWPPPAPKIFRYEFGMMFGLELLDSSSFGRVIISVCLLNFPQGAWRSIHHLHISGVKFRQVHIVVFKKISAPMLLDNWHDGYVARPTTWLSFCCYTADIKSTLLLLLLLVRGPFLILQETCGDNCVLAWLKWNSLMLEYHADIVVGVPAGHIYARNITMFRDFEKCKVRKTMILFCLWVYLFGVKIKQVHITVINISSARIREGHQLIILLNGNVGEKAKCCLKSLACADGEFCWIWKPPWPLLNSHQHPSS